MLLQKILTFFIFKNLSHFQVYEYLQVTEYQDFIVLIMRKRETEKLQL